VLCKVVHDQVEELDLIRRQVASRHDLIEFTLRDLAFILGLNSASIAMSRAKGLVVTVANPRIADSAAVALPEKKVPNLFCVLH
jgi:hypothetical protein